MKQLSISLFVVWGLSAFSQGTVQPIELMNVVDGKTVSISPCSGCKGVVVIFTSLNCPYDQHYQDRIKALYEKYNGRISFYLINANPGTEENDEKMKAAYAKWNMSIPYLADKSQAAMVAFNAKRTPEAILLTPEGKALKIVYQGAIDDNPQVHTDTSKDFLDDAISELTSGKPIKVPAERVIGCIIRKVN
jgi:thiol-disulfide isomerase/thioredoxin